MMDKEELKLKIEQLEAAAEKCKEPEKTFLLADVSSLKIRIRSMVLDDIVTKLNQIDLPKIYAMNAAIAEANSAVISHNKRVEAFNKAYTILKRII